MLKLTKCKLDKILGSKQYKSVLWFFAFLSFGHFSGYLDLVYVTSLQETDFVQRANKIKQQI